METTKDAAERLTRLGDEAFGRVQAHFPEAKHWRLALAQPLAPERFSRIRSAVLTYLGASLGRRGTLDEATLLDELIKQRDTLANYSPGGMLLPKREQLVEFNLVHAAVAAAVGDYKLADVIEGIDLPINVRVVYGQPAAGPPAPFSSSKLHLDVWAGVPVDSVVCVLPVLGDIDNLTIVFGEMERELEAGALRAMDDYDEGRGTKMAVPYRDGTLRHGLFCMSDERLLHQTVRHRKQGVRVSIDFRFRMNHAPYRAVVPEVAGPEGVDTRVPYAEWARIGTEDVIVFDETMAEAARAKPTASSLPVYDGDYRVIPVFPQQPR